jgi:hypothetical protein
LKKDGLLSLKGFPEFIYIELGDCKEFKVKVKLNEEIEEYTLEAGEESEPFLSFLFDNPYSFEIIDPATGKGIFLF